MRVVLVFFLLVVMSYVCEYCFMVYLSYVYPMFIIYLLYVLFMVKYGVCYSEKIGWFGNGD